MSGPTVTLGFAGDAAGLHKEIGKISDDTATLAKNVANDSVDIRSAGTKIGEGFDNAAARADDTRESLRGFAHTIEGATTLLSGPGGGAEGLAIYAIGLGQLAGGVANFAIPAFKKLAELTASDIADKATSVVASGTSAAAAVASWTAQAAAAVAGAASIAASWVIAYAPVILIVAAVVALAVAIYKNWDTIKGAVAAGAQFVKDRLDEVVGFFQRVPGYLGTAMSTVADVITAPYREAFGLIKKLWNDTVGGFRFEIPSWIPGVGGKGFSIPKMHAGGIIPGPPGTEVPMIGMAGEYVGARSSQGGSDSGNTYVITAVTPEAIVNAIRAYDRANGTGIAA